MPKGKKPLKMSSGSRRRLFSKSACPEFQHIASFEKHIRTWLESRALPNPFGEGIYMIPRGIAAEVSTQLAEFRADREALINALSGVYNDRIKEAQKEHGHLARTDDFPLFEEYRKDFKMKVAYRRAGIDENLYVLGETERQRAETELHQEIAQTREMVTSGLREEFAKLIDQIGSSLRNKENGGKKGRLYEGTLNKLTEWLTLFEKRNILSDDSLRDQVTQAKALMGVADADTLRTDTQLRDHVRDGFRGISGDMDRILMRPNRKVW